MEGHSVADTWETLSAEPASTGAIRPRQQNGLWNGDLGVLYHLIQLKVTEECSEARAVHLNRYV